MKRIKEHKYFSCIDTEFKAYILGWIYADGCLLPANGCRQPLFCISVQEEDGKEFLPHLASEITGRLPSRRYAPAQIRNNEKPQMRVSISSTQIFNDLCKLGLQPGKTYNGMKYPEIDKSLEHHFIRGFMDGDGSIIYSQTISSYVPVKKDKTNKLRDRGRIAFTGTDKIFLETLLSKLPITKQYWRSVQKTATIYTVWIERNQDVRNCIDFLYENATWFLTRKRNKAIKIISSEALRTRKERSETTGEV